MKTGLKRALCLCLALLLSLTLLPAAFAEQKGEASLAINALHFPDEGLRGCVARRCDANGDGLLSRLELGNITSLDCSASGVRSLEGIELLTSLKKLNCSDNPLGTLSLNGDSELQSLDCSNSGLTSLDLSGCTALEELNCSSNELRSLDLSDCGALKTLYCHFNELSSLSLTKNRQLRTLCCDLNPIASLSLKNNPKLQELSCANTRVKTLSLSKNTALKILTCYSALLTELSLENNPKLQELNCWSNSLTELDLTKNTALKELWCDNNRLTKLLVKSPALKKLHCSDNRLSALDLTQSDKLNELDCSGNQLKKLRVHADAPLKRLKTDKGVETVRISRPPIAPQLTGSLNAQGKPVLSWGRVSGAASYQIYRSATGKAGSFKRIATVTDTSYTAAKAGLGVTWVYKVRGVTATDVKGKFSAAVKLSAAIPAPKLRGDLNGDGKPVLSWKAVPGAEKYELYRSATGKAGSFKRLATVTGTDYTSKKAEPGSTWYYKLRGVSGEVKGAFSEIVELTAELPAPTLSGSLNAKGKPTLRWDAVPGAESYQIYRSATGEAGSFGRVATVTDTSYTDTKAGAGEKWTYKVRALTALGDQGPFSALVRLTAK